MKLTRTSPHGKWYITKELPDDPEATLVVEESFGDISVGNHYLSREEAQELVAHLIRWIQTGSLKPDP